MLMETSKQLHDFVHYRRFAEPRMDEMMNRVSPGRGWCFDLDGTARLLDTENQRLLLDAEPTIDQQKCLAAFRLECYLRGRADFRFEINDALYNHEDGKKFLRYDFNADSISWTATELTLHDWVEAQTFAASQAPSDAERAARAKEDMERLEGLMRKPDSVKE